MVMCEKTDYRRDKGVYSREETSPTASERELPACVLYFTGPRPEYQDGAFLNPAINPIIIAVRNFDIKLR